MTNIAQPPVQSAAVQSTPAQRSPQFVDEDGFNFMPFLIQIWQAVLRWKIVLGGIVIGCLIIALIVTLLSAPLFTSRTRIEVSREQKNVTNVQGLEAQDPSRDLEFYATQYALLEAESLAIRVVRKLKLAETDDFFEAHGAKPSETLEGLRDPAERRRVLAKREKQASKLLLANVTISPIRNSKLIDVKYTSRSPELSARIANTWVIEFIGATMDRQFASTADARQFLETRLAELRQKVEQSERALAEYATANGIVTLDTVRDADGRTTTQRTLATVDLEAMNSGLAKAKADRIQAESRLKSSNTDNSPELLTNPAVTTMRARRAELSAEYARLMVQFEPGYPAAMAVKQQIDAIDAAIARETARVRSSRQQEYNEALAREREFQTKVDGLKLQSDKQRQAFIQYNIYQREVDTNRQLYDALLQRYKEIGVAGTVGASNIAVVDVAEVPSAPSAPSMPLNLALGLLAGLGLAALTVLGLEQIDEGIRNPDDVRNHLKLPLLGNVPLSEAAPLEEIRDPKSGLSEAYFSIHSTLAFATSHGLPRSLAVTSAQPGEGKSTTSFALAEIIGRTGKNVLLIDGDLRSPSIHSMAGVSNATGFSNLLAGDALGEQHLHKLDKRGLTVMGTGPIPLPQPSC